MFRAALLALIAVALSMPAISSDPELKIRSMDIIPEKVRQAAEKAVPGISLSGVKLERGKSENGLVYEVGGVAEGKRYKLEITADGEVLEVGQEDDQIPLSDVPEVAKKAALNAVPGGKLVEAELIPSKSDAKVYELEVVKDGKAFEVRVSAKGEVKKVTERLGRRRLAAPSGSARPDDGSD